MNVDPNTLDPGIKNTVQWLQDHNFTATDSGDGVSKLQGEDPYACALPFPHVVMVTPPADMYTEADRLWQLLLDTGFDVDASFVENEQVMPCINIEATYSPANKTSMILLTGINDALLWAAHKVFPG